ncbi:MAG: hypothetical protein HQ582_16145 [Planctomycetes bacterium]|nr:hypothetical protein [Planctomycetota bacterium]
MQYSHTEHGWFHYGLYLSVAATLWLAWLIRGQPFFMWMVLGAAAVLFLYTQTFHYLSVRDEDDCLAICFGPLPLLRKRIPYAQITSAEPDRTSLIDGWGIHYVPWRGVTYNIWGYDCVKLQVWGCVVRVGSDDVENLVDFLRERIGHGKPE